MNWIFQKLFGKHSNQKHITLINTQPSPAENYLLLDFAKKLEILSLYTVSSVASNCTSIKLYQSVVNIEIEILGKKP